MKKRVAIVHGQLGGGNGGSEARAMWAAQALKRDFAVSLVTAGPVDLCSIEPLLWHQIGSEDVSIRRLPMPRSLSGPDGAQH